MPKPDPSKRSKRTRKRPTNLSLDVDALERAERYSRRHGTSLSKLVNEYLRSLPNDADVRPLSPVVRRLRGVAAQSKAGQEEYRRHLGRKYGAK